MHSLKINERQGGITIQCRVSPRAGKSKIKGERDGVLQVALAAPPVEGKANEALIELIAKSLGIPHSRVSILRGEKSRNKVVFIQGVDKTTLAQMKLFQPQE